LDANVLDLALLDGAHEVRIGDRVARRSGRSALEHAVEQRQEQHDDNPKSGVTVEGVHWLFRWKVRSILNVNRPSSRKKKRQPEWGAGPCSCHVRAAQSTSPDGFAAPGAT